MTEQRSWSRRDFLRVSAAGVAAFSAIGRSGLAFPGSPSGETTKVALLRTTDRDKAVAEILKMVPFPSPQGKKVFIKPNFNTADPPPGSTHNDTLRRIVLELKERGASQIAIGDRCGPGNTKNVMEDKGIPALARELGAEVVNFEELPPEGWVHLNPAGSHWKDGFDLARPLAEAEYVVSTCCLKTHAFGGHYTMSMKLSVGGVHRKFMRELHGSPDQRKMIAEVNLGYKPQLIVLDGIEAFVDGGPMTGKQATAGVFLAGTDRVAVDAVGVAVLRSLGSNETIMGRKVFEQDQIRRAVELGLGVSSPEAIEIVTADPDGRAFAEKIKALLA